MHLRKQGEWNLFTEMNNTEHGLLVLLNKHCGLRNTISSFADSVETLLGLL